MVLSDLLPRPEEKLCHTLWPWREAGGRPEQVYSPSPGTTWHQYSVSGLRKASEPDD